METDLKERIRDRLIREEREDAKNAYSLAMSDAEVKAFIARLHEMDAAWDSEQIPLTDSVPIIREMRAERTKQLMRRSGGNLCRPI
jgi:hypothetical protein